jgi:hypothetical protein
MGGDGNSTFNDIIDLMQKKSTTHWLAFERMVTINNIISSLIKAKI